MSKTSVKSTALEQRVSLSQDGTGPWLMQILTRYGLLLLCIALVIFHRAAAIQGFQFPPGRFCCFT